MSIKIHIRVSEETWDTEHELAETVADMISNIVPTEDIPVYVIPVEED